MTILKSTVLLILFLTVASGANNFISQPEKEKTNILPVPIFRQSTSYSCGAAALQSVLHYWKVSEEGEMAFHEPLQTDKEFGTHPVSIANYVKSLGLKVELKTQTSFSDLESAIDRKEPVIVDFQGWGPPGTKDYSNIWEDGHYGVIIGYDETYFYLMDPVLGSSYGKLEKNDFLRRWHDIETRNGKAEYFIQSAIFISGIEKLKKFPSETVLIN